MVGRWWYEMLKFILKCSWGTSLWPLEIQQVYRSFGSFGSFLRRRFPVEPSVIFANFSSVLVPLTPRHLWSSSQRSAIDDMLYNEPDCRYILYSGCMQVVQTCSNPCTAKERKTFMKRTARTIRVIRRIRKIRSPVSMVMICEVSCARKWTKL